MNCSIRPLAALAACILFSTSAAFAARVEIPCGRDATLFSSCGCYADGAGPSLYSGQTRYFGSRRALLWFSVADSIPAGSRIDSVQVRLQVEQVASGSQVHTLHRVLTDWAEGPSTSSGGGGVPAVSGDVTWTHAIYTTTPWNAEGSDHAPAPSGTATVGDVGEALWNSTPELVADVQSWLDGSQNNFGWVLIGDESTDQTAKRFASRESATVDWRPLLIIDFTPPLAIENRSWGAIKRLFATTVPEVRG